MADTTITNLPNASALTGTERVPMDQAGVTVDATTQAIADLSATAISTAVANHAAAADPHPVYLTQAEGDARYDLLAAATAFTVRALVRNNSGASIAKGVPVYVTGSSGTTITVAPADASTEATASQTLGLTEAAIADNADGYVVAVGLLTGLNTSALSEGQIVWLSETTGGLTTTRPTQPAHGVVIGYCVKQAAGAAGEIYVKVDNGLELAELHDVLLTGATTGQVLQLQADGLWKPASVAAGPSPSSSIPQRIGTGAAGSSADYARGDHIHPGPNWYKVGNWIMPANVSLAAGAGFVVDRIALYPFSVDRSIGVDELGARVATALAGSLFQLAIYGSSAGLPTGLPLASTGSLSGASAVPLSAVVTQFTLLAGELYWFAANVSGSGNTMVFISPGGSLNTYATSILGAETFATITSSGAQYQWNRTVTQTFGTWPNLTGITTTLVSSSFAPAIFMKVAALP